MKMKQTLDEFYKTVCEQLPKIRLDVEHPNYSIEGLESLYELLENRSSIVSKLKSSVKRRVLAEKKALGEEVPKKEPLSIDERIEKKRVEIKTLQKKKKDLSKLVEKPKRVRPVVSKGDKGGSDLEVEEDLE